MPVLIEKPGRRSDQLVGRSPYLQPVHVAASAGGIGEIVDVSITSAEGNSLFGEVPAGRSAAA